MIKIIWKLEGLEMNKPIAKWPTCRSHFIMSFWASSEGTSLILDSILNTDLPCSDPISGKQKLTYITKPNQSVQHDFFRWINEIGLRLLRAFRLKSKVTSSTVLSSSCFFSSSRAWPIRCRACMITQTSSSTAKPGKPNKANTCSTYPLYHGFCSIFWSSLQDTSQDVDENFATEQINHTGES